MTAHTLRTAFGRIAGRMIVLAVLLTALAFSAVQGGASLASRLSGATSDYTGSTITTPSGPDVACSCRRRGL